MERHDAVPLHNIAEQFCKRKIEEIHFTIEERRQLLYHPTPFCTQSGHAGVSREESTSKKSS
jgi:hypothetical protein